MSKSSKLYVGLDGAQGIDRSRAEWVRAKCVIMDESAAIWRRSHAWCASSSPAAKGSSSCTKPVPAASRFTVGCRRKVTSVG
jgi:hypothetical protein